MKKTTQIHIGGRHLYIDEDAYQKLNHYIEALKAHFAADGETGREIVEDIEQRVAELLENKLTNGKQAVTLEDVHETIGTLGKVEDFVYNDTEENRQEYDYGNRKDYRRFYRDSENYYLGGVASGLGKYFDIDPLWIRLAFVALVFLKGAGVLIYLILWIVVPKARTTAERLQMRGKPVNLTTIKNSVNEEYEKTRAGIESTVKSPAAERTRNSLENLMRAVGLIAVAVFKFFIGAIGIFFLIIGSIFLAVFIMFILGFTNLFGHVQLWNGVNFPDVGSFFANSGHYYMVVIALIVLVIIPIFALIYGGIKILFDVRTKHPVLRAFLLTAWILALILFITLVIVNVPNSPIEASGSQSDVIKTGKYPQMVIDVRDNTADKRIINYRVLGYRFDYSKWDEDLYYKPALSIGKSEDDQVHLTIEKQIKNVDPENSERYFDRIRYSWDQTDSALYLDEYYNTDEEDFWLFSKVNINLRIPEGKQITLAQKTCDILSPDQQKLYCRENSVVDKKCLISEEGVLIPAK